MHLYESTKEIIHSQELNEIDANNDNTNKTRDIDVQTHACAYDEYRVISETHCHLFKLPLDKLAEIKNNYL